MSLTMVLLEVKGELPLWCTTINANANNADKLHCKESFSIQSC